MSAVARQKSNFRSCVRRERGRAAAAVLSFRVHRGWLACSFLCLASLRVPAGWLAESIVPRAWLSFCNPPCHAVSPSQPTTVCHVASLPPGRLQNLTASCPETSHLGVSRLCWLMLGSRPTNLQHLCFLGRVSLSSPPRTYTAALPSASYELLTDHGRAL